jgi:hypothetical protein
MSILLGFEDEKEERFSCRFCIRVLGQDNRNPQASLVIMGFMYQSVGLREGWKNWPGKVCLSG